MAEATPTPDDQSDAEVQPEAASSSQSDATTPPTRPPASSQSGSPLHRAKNAAELVISTGALYSVEFAKQTAMKAAGRRVDHCDVKLPVGLRVPLAVIGKSARVVAWPVARGAGKAAKVARKLKAEGAKRRAATSSATAGGEGCDSVVISDASKRDGVVSSC